MENTLSAYERIRSVITCIVVSIIALVLIGVGIHLATQPTRKATVEGVVKSVDSSSQMMNISYTIGEHTYNLSTTGTMPVGTSVLIYYDQSNPMDARISTQLSNKTISIILILGAIVVTGLVYFNTYFVFKSKQYAAVTGGLDVAGQVLGGVRYV